MDANITGLSAREVTERRERGEGGAAAECITKSRAQIVRENVFTLFNLLNFIIAALFVCGGRLHQYAVSCSDSLKYCGRDCAGTEGEKSWWTTCRS